MARKPKTPAIAPATITIPYDTYESLRSDASRSNLSGNKFYSFIRSLERKGFLPVDFISVRGMTAAFSPKVVVLVNSSGSIELNRSDIKCLLSELPSLEEHVGGSHG